MDTAIANGDFLLDDRGRPLAITGMQEILQRILIRLTVKKGSFIFDPDLGSNLYTLKTSGLSAKGDALKLVREALQDMKGISVENVSLTPTNGGDRMELYVQVSAGENKGEVGVLL